MSLSLKGNSRAHRAQRSPFTVYLQGGLACAHGKIALISALEKMTQGGNGQ